MNGDNMAFDQNKFTIKAQEAIQNAIEIAQNYQNQMLEPEHLLASLIEEKENIVSTIIEKTGGNVGLLQIRVNELLEKLPKVSGTSIGNQQLSQALSKFFDQAAQEAKNLKDEFV